METGKLVSDLSHLLLLFIRVTRGFFSGAHVCLGSVEQKLDFRISVRKSYFTYL